MPMICFDFNVFVVIETLIRKVKSPVGVLITEHYSTLVQAALCTLKAYNSRLDVTQT